MIVGIKKLKQEGFQGHRERLVLTILLSYILYLLVMFQCLIYLNCFIVDGDRLPWPTSPTESGKSHWILLRW
jgi:hypothetical protein